MVASETLASSTFYFFLNFLGLLYIPPNGDNNYYRQQHNQSHLNQKYLSISFHWEMVWLACRELSHFKKKVISTLDYLLKIICLIFNRIFVSLS